MVSDMIEALERSSEANFPEMVEKYRTERPEQPLRELSRDVLERIHLYSGIMERQKQGDTVQDLQKKFGSLVVDFPKTSSDPAMITHCLDKIDKYRSYLIRLVTRYGPKLMAELGATGSDLAGELGVAEFSGGLAVKLGIPPDLELSVVFTRDIESSSGSSPEATKKRSLMSFVRRRLSRTS